MTRLVQALTLLLAATSSVSAFGPATPVNSVVTNTNQNGMTMRVSLGDANRRTLMKDKLQSAVKDSPEATKAAIESELLSEKTSAVIEKMNWKRRKAMIRKVKGLAYANGVPVDASFGVPATLAEKQEVDVKAGAARAAAKKIKFAALIEERDVRVAARRKAEAGSEAEKIKQQAIRNDALQAVADEKEAELAEIEAQKKRDFDATQANAEDADDVVAAAAQAVKDKSTEQPAKKED